MRYPNFNEEKKLWRRGFKFVAGLDEAGRGPLAGPVVAAAVAINPKSKILSSKQAKSSNIRNSKRFKYLDFDNLNLFRNSNLEFRILLKEVRDSKKLTPVKREKLYKLLINNLNIRWGIGRVSEKVIDRINILEATKLAMKKAIDDLEKKCRKNSPSLKLDDRPFFTKDGIKFGFIVPDFLILDGNFKINSTIPQKSIIKGDEKVFSCAAASIIAKVTRDRIMLKYDKKYPKYGFKKHKGYPTKFHRRMIKKFGHCPIHRKTFSWI